MRDVETQEEKEDEETQTVVNTVCERKKKNSTTEKRWNTEREKKKKKIWFARRYAGSEKERVVIKRKKKNRRSRCRGVSARCCVTACQAVFYKLTMRWEKWKVCVGRRKRERKRNRSNTIQKKKSTTAVFPGPNVRNLLETSLRSWHTQSHCAWESPRTNKQADGQANNNNKKKMSKCAPRKSSYDSASLQASAVSEKPLFFFNNRIQLATQSDRGKNNRKPDTVCYMERTKKKKADYEITKKKKMAHP